jgi:hypothetical protein
MRPSRNEQVEEQVLGDIPLSRSEVQTLIEVLNTLFSSPSTLEEEVQDAVLHLLHSLEHALLVSAETPAPITFDLSLDELLLLTLAAATITAPYRAGIPVPAKDQPLCATLSPLVEKLLSLVEQIQALQQQRAQIS